MAGAGGYQARDTLVPTMSLVVSATSFAVGGCTVGSVAAINGSSGRGHPKSAGHVQHRRHPSGSTQRMLSSAPQFARAVLRASAHAALPSAGSSRAVRAVSESPGARQGARRDDEVRGADAHARAPALGVLVCSAAAAAVMALGWCAPAHAAPDPAQTFSNSCAGCHAAGGNIVKAAGPAAASRPVCPCSPQLALPMPAVTRQL